ncbi:MAG: hypothetical protein JSR59_22915 [Proteobacteria bacterium]|nr:hypothetical protein [Pseudomonadota bacterium]
MLAAMLALLGGCSAVRFAYDRAPVLVYWWLDGYVDFDDAQKPRVRAAIAGWFAWHRRSQLVDYADLLARAETEALADTTPERACQWWHELQRRVDAATDALAGPAAELVVTLTPAQIDHIERRYARYNDDFRDDFLQQDAAERREATEKRTFERAQMLYGRLDDGQRTVVRQLLAESPFDPEAWFAERRYRQQEALQAMRRLVADHASRDEAEAALRVYFAHMKESPREAYRAYQTELTRYNCAFTARLHNRTTAAQRQAAVRKLKGWESDLRALAAATP